MTPEKKVRAEIERRRKELATLLAVSRAGRLEYPVNEDAIEAELAELGEAAGGNLEDAL